MGGGWEFEGADGGRPGEGIRLQTHCYSAPSLGGFPPVPPHCLGRKALWDFEVDTGHYGLEVEMLEKGTRSESA